MFRVFRFAAPAFALLLLLSMCRPASAQGAVAAGIAGIHLTAGVEGGGFATYYQNDRGAAVGVYADLDTRYLINVEGEARFIRFNLPQNEEQDTYLVGPKFVLFHLPRTRPYVKALFGDGQMTYPGTIGHGSYFVAEGGVGVDFRLTRHLVARGEYDGQYWPSAPTYPGQSNSDSLKPNGGVIGLAWRFF